MQTLVVTGNGITNVEPELKKRVTELNLSFDVQIIQSAEQLFRPFGAKIEGGSVQTSRLGSEVKEYVCELQWPF